MIAGKYSPYIYEIIAWLEGIGVAVDPFASLPDGIIGRYHSDDEPKGPRIEVIGGLPARDALMTIAHEAGHHLGYLIDRKPNSYQRERQAYVYGWHVLRWFDAPVTREEWRADCRMAEWDRKASLRERVLNDAYESYEIDEAELEALAV